MVFDASKQVAQKKQKEKQMNLHVLQGRLGADPKVSEKEGRVTRASFSVATDTFKKEGEKLVKGDPHWHNVVVFGGQASYAARALQKGSQVLIQGQVVTRTYGEGEDKKYITETIANQLTGLGGLKPRTEAPVAAGAPAGEDPDPLA